jgi:hypothetical protein
MPSGQGRRTGRAVPPPRQPPAKGGLKRIANASHRQFSFLTNYAEDYISPGEGCQYGAARYSGVKESESRKTRLFPYRGLPKLGL